MGPFFFTKRSSGLPRASSRPVFLPSRRPDSLGAPALAAREVGRLSHQEEGGRDVGWRSGRCQLRGRRPVGGGPACHLPAPQTLSDLQRTAARPRKAELQRKRAPPPMAGPGAFPFPGGDRSLGRFYCLFVVMCILTDV